MCLAALSPISGIRRYFYECFLGLHTGTTGVAVAALSQHLSAQKAQARFYIFGGVAVWTGLCTIYFLVNCYYNINFGPGHWLPKVNIVKVYRTENYDQVVLLDACHLEVQVNRRWHFRPGAYLFISIPALGLTSIFQSHPFWIIWWETDPTSGVTRLDVLVRRRRCFTRRLL